MRQRRALGLVFAATPAAAQCLLCAQDKTAGVAARGTETPLRVEVEARLDMGRVAVGAMGGEVEVDPVSGARRVRGDPGALGGFALTGVGTVRGEPEPEERRGGKGGGKPVRFRGVALR